MTDRSRRTRPPDRGGRAGPDHARVRRARRRPAGRWTGSRAGTTAGLSLFRFKNVESLGQVADLVAALQRADGTRPADCLVAVDQEGGQLNSLGVGTTLFPGNMALGAAGRPDADPRTWRAAIGRECAAMGVHRGLRARLRPGQRAAQPRRWAARCFGSDPVAVAASMRRRSSTGLAAAGVAGAAKHFPGSGAITVDTARAGAASIAADRDGAATPGSWCRSGRPSRRASAMVMSAHVAVPAVTGDAGAARDALVGA